jgi:hypothetical protein
MRLTICGAALALLLPAAAESQRPSDEPLLAVSPALLEYEGDHTVAARFAVVAGSRRHDLSRAFPSSRYWRAEGRGTVALKEELNPDPLALDLAGGIALSLAKPRVITFDPENVDAPGSAMEFDYGDVSLGAQARLEANQAWTEARASLGAELIYTHDKQGGLWPFVPSLHAALGVARPLESEVRDSLLIRDEESYVRLAGGIAWHVSADRGWMPRPLRPVWLHAEIEIYRDSGVEDELEAAGVNDGTRVVLGTAYRLLGTERPLVHEIFLRWTNGETPALPAPRKAWMLGIVLAP